MDLNKKYLEYIVMTEDEQRDYLFLVDFALVDDSHLEEKDYMSEVAIEDLSFGTIKRLMKLYKTGDIVSFCNLLFSLKQYGNLDKIYNELAWKVILTVRFVLKRIESLIQIENQTLSSPSEYAMYVEQIDFTMFDVEWFQLNDLSGGDITKFEAIRELPYSDCFVQLLYKFKNSELEKAILKSTKIK